MSTKAEFIEALAKYLVEGQTDKSVDIRVGIGTKEAHAWQALRAKTPLFGYPTLRDARATLTTFLA